MYILITVKIANNSRWVRFGPYYELIWKTNPFSKKYVVIVPSTVRIFLLFLIFDDSNFQKIIKCNQNFGCSKYWNPHLFFRLEVEQALQNNLQGIFRNGVFVENGIIEDVAKSLAQNLLKNSIACKQESLDLSTSLSLAFFINAKRLTNLIY